MPTIRRNMITASNARIAWGKLKGAWVEGGVREVARRSVDYAAKMRSEDGEFGPVVHPERWPGAVVMLADTDPPQCWHYRVEQKQEAAALLGVPFRVTRPTSSRDVLSALQLAGVLIVYRQPDSSFLQQVITEARRLGILVVYEADDAVYRRDLVAGNPNLATLPAKLRADVIAGADRYLAALQHCDAVLASTSDLADDMADHLLASRVPNAFVISNGIDMAMRAAARGVATDRAAGRIRRNGDDGAVVVGYGSGSRAHDVDLAVVGGALRRLLAEDPRVRLRLFGPLAVPPELTEFSGRIERFPLLPDGQYLWELAQCDIAIAPLDDAGFNHYKSQVKYLEAGLLGLPLVASPTVYGDYIVPGRTGMIAVDSDEWYGYLRELAGRPELRARMGAAAAEHVARWEVSAEPAQQLAAALQHWGVTVPPMGSRRGAPTVDRRTP